MSKLRKFLVFVLTLSILLILPTWLILIGCMICIRQLAVRLAKFLRPDFGSIIPARSAIFGSDLIYNNTKTRSPKYSIIITARIKGDVSVEKFRSNVSQAVEKKVLLSGQAGQPAVDDKDSPSLLALQYPQLRQTVYSWFGILFWKWDTKFTIEKHVRSLDLAKFTGMMGVDSSTSLHVNGTNWRQDDLMISLGNELLSKPFAKGQSPWEFLVVEDSRRTGPKTTTLVIFRVHHVIGDGISFLKFCLDSLDSGDSSVEIQKRASQGQPNSAEISFSNGKTILQLPKFLLTTLAISFHGAHDLANLIINTWDSCNPWKVNDTSKFKVSITESIPLDYVKAIKNEHGTSFASVLMTILTSALKVCGPPKQLPNFLHSITILPFPGHSKNGLSNHMTATVVRLPMKLTSPRAQLQAIDQQFKIQTNSSFPSTMFYLLELLGLNFLPIAHFLCSDKLHTCIVSNFAIPNPPAYLFGFEILDAYFAPGFGNQGLGLTALSYNGKLRLTIGIDEKLLSANKLECEELTKQLMKELRLLGKNLHDDALYEIRGY